MILFSTSPYICWVCFIPTYIKYIQIDVKCSLDICQKLLCFQLLNVIKINMELTLCLVIFFAPLPPTMHNECCHTYRFELSNNKNAKIMQQQII